jgi:hypothetical protein
MESSTPGQSERLLDQVRNVMRSRHYAIRTEEAYCDWIRRFVKFHRMQSRAELAGGTDKVEAFLTHLAVAENVAPIQDPARCGGITWIPARSTRP